MNTDRLRSDLQVLSARAATPSTDLAELVLDRGRRRARSRWAATGVAVAVGAAIVATPALLSTADRGSTAAPTGDAVGGLFDEPIRGSLAADADVVTDALAASWDDGLVGGADRAPAEVDRRVAFIGVVPGGQVWSLVVGVGEQGLVGAWFVDVDTADGVQLQLAATPSHLDADAPVALVDVAADPAPLVVVGAVGEQFATQGPGSAEFLDLVPDDGVAVTQVPGPVTPAALPRYAVVEDDVVTGRFTPSWFDSRLPLGPRVGAEPGVVFPADPVHGARIALCLQEARWPVTMLADGSLAYIGQLAATADPAFQADLARCQVESGYR